eukprot:gb/GECG01004692.1/.p1 GENE.gb/GECG01004692.1/~~gb/GECG01004692.1/.p1  ORF type:complete len:607 (+),score=36.59 gb/GECG01004692.1/:1-1821(+)
MTTILNKLLLSVCVLALYVAPPVVAVSETFADDDYEAPEHTYAYRDEVPVMANKVGPLGNPSETYHYYSMPFCRPKNLEKQAHELGEHLAGDRKVNTLYDIRFRVTEEWRELCKKTIKSKQIQKFVDAIEQEYYYEIFLDDLPIWGFVGEEQVSDVVLGSKATNKYYLYTHMHFDISYNGDHIIGVNVTTDPKQAHSLDPQISEQRVVFSYSVNWKKTNKNFANRLEMQQSKSFLPATLEIHWLSIINSLVLAVLLTAFLSIILLRVVKNDFTRYMRAEGDPDVVEPETGWKLIHGDVFRVPRGLNLLCALLGTGAQLLVVGFTLLAMALMGTFVSGRRGSMMTSAIVLYCLTGFIGGYVAARLYRMFRGSRWAWNIVLTSLVFPLPLLLVFSFVNTAAIIRHSTAALPFSTIMVILAMWLLVAFPLTVLGGIAGRHSTEWKPPCRTNKVPRQIPELPLWRRAPTQAFIAGFLPFSAISIELHYIFASIWGYRVYTVFGILMLAFVLLIVVVSFVTIALTYFQLAGEDWRWWWRSMLCGGTVSLFIYLYCFFFHINHSEMQGFLQLSYFYGYSAVMSYAAFLMLGFVGFISSFLFVRYLYSQVKSD